MSTEKQKTIGVVGAGAWGTALALLLARNGNRVIMWGREIGQLEEMARVKSNPFFLPGFPFPDNLQIALELDQMTGKVDFYLLAVPSIGFRSTVENLAEKTGGEIRIIWASKGFEPQSGRLLHEIIQDTFSPEIAYAIISGPTFATEVAKGLPTAITMASNRDEFALELIQSLHNDKFRVYTSHDIIGIEVGGAVKNVLAIAAGIADGLDFGANTRAALITRGLAEIMRLGLALGGKRETFMGLAGMGDLVLTCTDNQSRNRRFGLALAAGQTMEQALKTIGQVVEGCDTVLAVHHLAEKMNIDMPISSEVYKVIHAGKSPQDAVNSLFSREQKAETV